MKKELKLYSLFSAVIGRTPLFPYSFLKATLVESNTSDDKLIELCKQPKIAEALFIASPDLHQSIKKWVAGEISIPKKVNRLRTSLLRYLIRMATRPTPFGIFAGLSVGKWAEETKIVFDETNKYRKSSRLDMNYLCALATDLGKIAQIKENILFYPNHSIYKVADKLRYVEYTQKDNLRNYNIVSIDNSDYLNIILSKSKNGAHYNAIINWLVDDEITIAESKEFIDELIDSQILINELEPSVTGTEYFEYIISVLDKIDGIDEIKNGLTKIQAGLQNVDRQPIGSGIEYYNKIIEDIDTLKTEYKRKYLFQVDLYKSAKQMSLSEEIKNEILRSLEVLNKISSAPEKTDLTNFKDEFYSRYEEQEIPLMEVMDTDIGSGYKQTRSAGAVSPLVDDILLPIKPEDRTYKFNAFSTLLLKKYINAIKNAVEEIELTDNDLKDFEVNWDNLPTTMTTMLSVKQESDNDFKILFPYVGGSSAANMLGRFCHINKEINEHVNDIIKHENNSDKKILAEIVHLPESRVGNILARPSLRKYEIPYLARAGVAKNNQITVADLLVSIRNNRILLRSKTLNKEIIPRMANAHSYKNNSLPVYEFLCDMQYQDVRQGTSFNWNPFFDEFDFLPRVRYRNTVFSLATWIVKITEFAEINKISEDKKLIEAVENWRTKRRIPKLVLLKEGDNTLLLNLQNNLCIKTLQSIVKNRGNFQLTEPFMIPQDISKWKEDQYVNEFVISFYKNENIELPKKRT